MGRRARLDAELVRRGLARSRDDAQALVASGRVMVAGAPALKASSQVDPGSPLVVTGEQDGDRYVSRGAHKLAGALDAFAADGLTVEGRRCLDAGASTGGFTDVLLRRGAAQVVAVDVGYGQMAWPLTQDDRVVVVDRVNARELTTAMVGGPVDVVVADLSFISLRLVLPALLGCLRPDGDALPMVKPQFEVGRDKVGARGVVRDPELRAGAVGAVVDAAAAVGWGARGVVASPLPGPSGNVEYFVWLRSGSPTVDQQAVRRAVEEGPQ